MELGAACGRRADHRVPDGALGRPHRCVRLLRTPEDLLQLVQEPPLSEVSGQRPQGLARSSPGPGAACTLRARGLHDPSAARAARASEPQSRLRSPAPYLGPDAPEIARNPKHLGARLGFFAILHTWGQTLIHHPHVHCVVPAGGLAEDGRTWQACRPGFFLPVRVLSRGVWGACWGTIATHTRSPPPPSRSASVGMILSTRNVGAVHASTPTRTNTLRPTSVRTSGWATHRSQHRRRVGSGLGDGSTACSNPSSPRRVPSVRCRVAHRSA